MSNMKKAAQMIRDLSEVDGETLGYAHVHNIAQALADAGLLAPDLPEPRIDIDGWQEWGHKHGNNVTLNNGMVTVEIPDDISRDLTPAEAQELATWLHAASYAEGNQE